MRVGLLISSSEDTGQAKFAEFIRLLKNSPYARFHPRLGTKYAVFGAFRARFVVAISSTPTFSTRCHLLGSRVNRDRKKGRGVEQPRPFFVPSSVGGSRYPSGSGGSPSSKLSGMDPKNAPAESRPRNTFSQSGAIRSFLSASTRSKPLPRFCCNGVGRHSEQIPTWGSRPREQQRRED